MATRGAVTLLKNASTTNVGVTWAGGRTALLIMGTLATTTKLQVMGQDGSTWIDVATISAVGLTNYDLPAGLYRISLASGSPAGIYADLIGIHY